MNFFVTKLPAERDRLITEAANRLGYTPMVVEKDFWVCWLLGELFDLPEFKDHLTFKGGTSLSKAYNVIGRFSEDIDLAIHRSFLGFDGDQEPESGSSKKEQARRIERLKEACIEAVGHRLLPLLKDRWTGVPTAPAPDRLELSDEDPQTILFRYPRCLEEKRESKYILPYVKVEIGARSDDWPLIGHKVHSYVETEFSGLLGDFGYAVKVLAVERTFWEKATILHAEYHRPAELELPSRLSRHYYDLYCLHRSEHSESALGSLNLLERVAEHKRIFFRRAWAQYEHAKPGSIRLSPPKSRLNALEEDYRNMSEMFFESPPSFREIMNGIAELEFRINEQGS